MVKGSLKNSVILLLIMLVLAVIWFMRMSSAETTGLPARVFTDTITNPGATVKPVIVDDPKVPYEDRFVLRVGGEHFFVSLAADAQTRAAGLSNTDPLREREGKLFVFPRADNYGFWMKEMNYPLDILWFSADGTVVHIEKNVTPETYPETFYPNALSRYVLEITAGKADEYGLIEGHGLYLSEDLVTCVRTSCFNK